MKYETDLTKLLDMAERVGKSGELNRILRLLNELIKTSTREGRERDILSDFFELIIK